MKKKNKYEVQEIKGNPNFYVVARKCIFGWSWVTFVNESGLLITNYTYSRSHAQEVLDAIKELKGL